MSNLNKAVEVLREAYREPSMSPVHACDIMADALEAAGLLAPGVQVIRTLKELEALDPDTALMQHQKGYRDSYIDYQRVWVEDCKADNAYIFPLVVMMTGDQVRAAREAMEVVNE